MSVSLPPCDDERRRSLVSSNGIDYLEVSDNQRTLRVYFLRKLPAAAYGLPTRPSLVEIVGGARIAGIRAIEVRRATDWSLEIDVSSPGDYSTYTLVLHSAELDPVYARREFSFKAGCPSPFDCASIHVCPATAQPEPLIDYLARDFASFRQSLMDFARQRIPNLTDFHAADAGMALLEVMAYAGDLLSYQQDAVANERFLHTARQRISAQRHARLIDYRLHDGASARVFVHFCVSPGAFGTIPKNTVLLTRIDESIDGVQPPHATILPATQSQRAQRLAAAVFETVEEVAVHFQLNCIPIYTWQNRECCLPRGTVSVDLEGDWAGRLSAGDLLLFEEVRGAESGLAADADPAHRQIVRLVRVESHADPIGPRDLTRVTWHAADALAFPLCLSITNREGVFVPNVSVARGNLALADHGLRRDEWHPQDPSTPGAKGVETGPRPYRFELLEGPLSFRVSPPPIDQPVAAYSTQSVRQATPEVVDLTVQVDSRRTTWTPISDLLSARPTDPRFAVESTNEGRGLLRFGDNHYGQALDQGAFVHATYRVGSGTAGNIGAEALAHVAPGAAPLPGLKSIRNPLPAWGGVDPETIEHARQIAPSAFRAEQFRAVTAADFVRFAEQHPQVSKAVARFRWTGSWLTVYLSIDPRGRTSLTSEAEESIRDFVSRFTVAGYDLEIDPPIYVPIDLELEICVLPEYFRADVQLAVLRVLSTDGLFAADNFTFGQRLFLSQLYARVESVVGVDSVRARRFRRLADHDPDPDRPATALNLDRGFIAIGSLEVVRMDNDPNFPENGRLRLVMRGGR